MDKEIGGYFGLELRDIGLYHADAIALNTARNSLEYILRARGYSKVYLPLYTCEVLYEPFEKTGVEYEHYPIGMNLEPEQLPQLREGEALLYTNYYGLKGECVDRLAGIYGAALIVDNAQAFYARPLAGVDTFYSARKFFGVSDGAYLVTECRRNGLTEGRDSSEERIMPQLLRTSHGAAAGYGLFHDMEESLCRKPVMQMSRLTEMILRSVDYEAVARRRRENYMILDERLGAINGVSLPLDEGAVPMVYPFYSEDTGLRDRLISKKIFVARYWPNVLEEAGRDTVEYRLAERLIPLPIDQRYGAEDMMRIAEAVCGK